METRRLWLGALLAGVLFLGGGCPESDSTGPSMPGNPQERGSAPEQIGAEKTSDGPTGEGVVPSFEGESVDVSGTVTLPEGLASGPIQIDLNGAGEKGGHLNSTIIRKPGVFTVRAPKNAGTVSLKLFIGEPGKDPGKRPYFEWGPLEVGSDDLTGLTVNLSGESPSVGSPDPVTP